MASLSAAGIEPSGSPEIAPLTLSLIKISRQLGKDVIEKCKTVYLGLPRIPVKHIKEQSNFSGLHNILTRYFPRVENGCEAVTFIYHVFKELEILLDSVDEATLHSKSIPDYNLRLKFQAVDCRLVVMKFIETLREDDYKSILDGVCMALKVHSERFRKRWELADGMFSERLLSGPDDITQVYKLAVIYQHRPLFSEYCSRHDLSEPDVTCELAVQSHEARSTFVAEIFKIERSKRHQKFSHSARSLRCTVFLTVVGLIGVIGGVSITVWLSVDTGAGAGGVNLTDSSIVVLNQNGFNRELRSVTLNLHTEDDSIAVNVYKDDCAKANMSSNHLPVHMKSELLATYFKRHPYNYEGEDTPIYGLNGSYLEFRIFADSNNSNPGCLKIRVFTNYFLYSDATNPGEHDIPIVDGTIAESPCLHIGESGVVLNSSWQYTFDKPQYVYTTIEAEANVRVNGQITGIIMNYTGSSLPLYSCSPLTTKSSRCSIDICGKACARSSSTPIQCIYLQMQQTDQHNDLLLSFMSQYEVLYTAQYPIYRLYFFITIALMVLIVSVSLVLIYCCNRRHDNAWKIPKVFFARQHSNQSDQHLLEDTNCVNNC